MQNYTSQNRLSQKFGVKDYSDDRTSVEVVGRVGVNTNEAVQSLDVRGSAYVSSDVGIGQTTFDIADPTNTSKLAVGIVTAIEYYGDGSKLENITNVAFADSLDKSGTGQLLYQQGNKITSLLEFGQTGQVLQSQGQDNEPVWANAAPAGAVEGFLIRDEGNEVGLGTTFGGLNFVGAAVSVQGTSLGGFATVTVNQNYAEVAGFASDSKVAGIASDAERVRLSDLSDDVQVFIPFSTEASGVTTINTNQNLTFNPSSGLLTATRFSGIGSDITDLDASELKFGTIPDSVFPDNLPADVIVGFAATAGIATTAVSAGVANTANILNLEDEGSDTENFITFAREATGNQRLKTNSTLKFNANDGTLSASKFSGDGSGLTDLTLGTIAFAERAGIATEAAGLATARNIFGISFDGTDNIDASSTALNVQGNIINAISITGKAQNLIIQPKDADSSKDIIIRGNNNTAANQSGGNVIIGDSGRGEIRFLSNIQNGFQFFKPNNTNISANLDTNQLTEDQDFTFPNKSGTFALIDDITEGQIAGKAATLQVDSTDDNTDYQLTFIEFNQTGLSTDFFSNSQITYNPSTDRLTVGGFVGIGTSLTNLDADNIDRGTLNTARLPNAIRLDSDITIDANGSEGNLRLDAGKNLIIRSGIDNDGTVGGQIILKGKRGAFSYKFLNPNDFDNVEDLRVACLDCTEILSGATKGDVFFKLPGNKTGSGNTFAMLDDITEGRAGTAEKIKVQTRNNNDVDYTIIFSQGAGDSQSIFNSGPNFTYNASTDVLKAPNFSGIGSLLTNLDAGAIDRGTLNTARLPATIEKFEDITINAKLEDGTTNFRNLTLRAAANLKIRAGDSIGAGITFIGNNGDQSYSFRRKKQGSSDRDIYLSFDDVNLNNKIFKLPNKSATGVSTFAMLDDITGDNGDGVTAGTARKLENDVELDFQGDVTGIVTFNGETPSSPISVPIHVTGGDVDFAAVAGVSTLAKIINASDDSDPAVYLTFVDDVGSDDRALKVDTLLSYDQSNEELVTDLRGTASNATDATNAQNVEIVNFDFGGATGSNDYSVYFGGPANGNQRLRKDDSFKYHTVSQILFVPKITASGIITAQDFNSTSDIKLKTNIERISDPIEKVLQIDGVSFNWIGNGKPSLGVIADNVQEVLPEIVTDGDPKTVNYNGLIGLLIEAVKEQQIEINSLKERLSKLE